MTDAEIKQFLLRGKIPDIDTYIEICEGKTAALFVSILKSSALLSGLDTIKAEKFAHDFGVLFQLKNDMEETSAETDKKNKIFTLNDILGIEKSNIFADNYLEVLKKQLAEVPKNKKNLEDLLDLL